MNPFFEQPGLWRGFHGLLLGQLSFALNSRITPRYHADYEESLYIDQPRPSDRTFFAVADDGVTENDAEAIADTAGGAAVAARPRAKPVRATVTAGIKKKRRWLTIRDTLNREVVTVIEILSPSNKASTDDRAYYLRCRRKLFRSNVNLVEIDLLRGGEPMPMNGVPDSDYRIMVVRRGRRPNVDVWPFDLREPLPEIPIPLAGTDPDVWLDLKPPLDAVYDGGAYRYRLYDALPDPPLTAEDAVWAAELVKVG